MISSIGDTSNTRGLLVWIERERVSHSRTPILLEDIAEMNRRRHEEQGGVVTEGEGGPLELEAIAAVHELCTEVRWFWVLKRRGRGRGYCCLVLSECFLITWLDWEVEH